MLIWVGVFGWVLCLLERDATKGKKAHTDGAPGTSKWEGHHRTCRVLDHSILYLLNFTSPFLLSPASGLGLGCSQT